MQIFAPFPRRFSTHKHSSYLIEKAIANRSLFVRGAAAHLSAFSSTFNPFCELALLTLMSRGI